MEQELTKEQLKKQRYEKQKATIAKKYGSNFFSKIGAKGGKVKRERPFQKDPSLASRAGIISGVKKREKKSKQKHLLKK